MDISALMSTMLGSDALGGIGQLSGVSDDKVKDVLGSALPALLSGAQSQADDAATAEGFVGALGDHAKADTGNIASFLSGVDLEDGGKIIGHLLGGKADSVTADAAEKAGVSAAQSGSVLAAAAPLLMSLLGQQTAQSSSAVFPSER